MAHPVLKCDVCERKPACVASSALGPVSFAYCMRCAVAWAEPYHVLVGAIALSGGRRHVAPWIEPIIRGTLEIVGKSEADLVADIDRAIADLRAEDPGS